MATKASVETKITAINDNGNNTAVEVRDVLTELLNFSDEGLTNNRLKTFHYWNPEFIRDLKRNLLWYSFKGIENLTVNFTFRISIKKISKEGYLFVPKELEQILKALSNIIDKSAVDKNIIHKEMDFLIKINNPEENEKVKKRFRIGSMKLTFSTKGILFQLECSNLNERIVPNDIICSSITFHCPKFKLV